MSNARMKRRPPTMEHNYLKRMVALHRAGGIRRGEMFRMDVKHDGWCDMYSGGYCNCDPEITIAGGVADA